MLSDLQASLHEFMGQPITPEIAARLYAAAVFSPDLAVDPARFSPAEIEGGTIQVESLRAIVDEMRPLHDLHWLETEGYRHGIPVCCDYEALLADEQAGRLVQFTVRRGGALAGSLRVYVGKSRHTSQMMAREDTLFIHPDHRIPWLAIKLVRYAVDALQSIGVREFFADSKLSNNADALMRRVMGKPVALQFHMILGTTEPSKE